LSGDFVVMFLRGNDISRASSAAKRDNSTKGVTYFFGGATYKNVASNLFPSHPPLCLVSLPPVLDARAPTVERKARGVGL